MKKQRPSVAVRGGGAGAIEGQVGQKARCRAPGSKRGGCRSRGSGGVGESSPGGQEPAAIFGEEQGTRCQLPSTGGAIAVRQEAEKCWAVQQRCPVPLNGTASESLSPC